MNRRIHTHRIPDRRNQRLSLRPSPVPRMRRFKNPRTRPHLIRSRTKPSPRNYHHRQNNNQRRRPPQSSHASLYEIALTLFQASPRSTISLTAPPSRFMLNLSLARPDPPVSTCPLTT